MLKYCLGILNFTPLRSMVDPFPDDDWGFGFPIAGYIGEFEIFPLQP